MKRFFSGLLLALATIALPTISSLPLGCEHEGTTYEEGEVVAPTDEPCLSCVCRRGSLSCNVRVCADPPDVPSPGCFVVRRADDCCPRILCQESHAENGLELRTAFVAENKTDENDCFINGSVYAEGSALTGSESCEYCYCIRGEIKCIKPRCFLPFEGCKPIYRESSCCPTHYDCRKPEDEASTILRKNQAKTYSESSDGSSGSLGSLSRRTESEPKGTDQPAAVPADETTSIPESEVTFSTTEPVTNAVKETESPVPAITIAAEEECTGETEISTFRFAENFTSNEFSFVNFDSVNERVPGERDGEKKTKMTKNQNSSRDATIVFGDDVPPREREISPSVNADADANDLNWKRTEVRSEQDFSDRREMKESEIVSDEVPSNNSSRVTDDYDSYDYGEPKLPPSLPNLIIYPFVAADAVVKEKPGTGETSHEQQNGLKKLGVVHRIGYEDGFSPPAKTEGGFVPRESLISSEGSDDFSYFGKDEISHPDSSYSFDSTKFSVSSGRGNESVRLKENDGVAIARPPTAEIAVDRLAPDPFGDVIKTEPAPDLSAVTDFASFYFSRRTTKPVTVAHKNVVVDYYPDRLVTSTRANVRIEKDKSSVESSVFYSLARRGNPEPDSTTTFASTAEDDFSTRSTRRDDATETAGPGLQEFPEERHDFSEKETVPTDEPVIVVAAAAAAAASASTGESSFSEEFLKAFSKEEDGKSTAVATEHKFSAKIKAQTTARTTAAGKTVGTTAKKPETGNIRGKEKKGNSSFSLLEILFEPSAAVRFATEEISRENHERTTVPDPEKSEDDRGTEPAAVSPSRKSKPNVGNLSKLAGCNIYGRMYRVGNIIVELSGPCSECVCTDAGVRCAPLNC